MLHTRKVECLFMILWVSIIAFTRHVRLLRGHSVVTSCALWPQRNDNIDLMYCMLHICTFYILHATIVVIVASGRSTDDMQRTATHYDCSQSDDERNLCGRGVTEMTR